MINKLVTSFFSLTVLFLLPSTADESLANDIGKVFSLPSIKSRYPTNTIYETHRHTLRNNITGDELVYRRVVVDNRKKPPIPHYWPVLVGGKLPIIQFHLLSHGGETNEVVVGIEYYTQNGTKDFDSETQNEEKDFCREFYTGKGIKPGSEIYTLPQTVRSRWEKISYQYVIVKDQPRSGLSTAYYFIGDRLYSLTIYEELVNSYFLSPLPENSNETEMDITGILNAEPKEYVYFEDFDIWWNTNTILQGKLRTSEKTFSKFHARALQDGGVFSATNVIHYFNDGLPCDETIYKAPLPRHYRKYVSPDKSIVVKSALGDWYNTVTHEYLYRIYVNCRNMSKLKTVVISPTVNVPSTFSDCINRGYVKLLTKTVDGKGQIVKVGDETIALYKGGKLDYLISGFASEQLYGSNWDMAAIKILEAVGEIPVVCGERE